MAGITARKLFAEGPQVYLLGIGTTWFGRPWPPDNTSYTYPDSEEITSYLDESFSKMNDKSTLVMIDTSSSYGTSEEKIGQYFKKRKNLSSKALIATKWGEEFNCADSQCLLEHSVKHLEASLQRSLSYLKKIDILYIHRTNNTVLKDKTVIEAMQKLKQNGKISYTGASFSNEKTLDEAVKESLISWCDLIQMPASVFLKRPDLISKIKQMNTAIVVNSPVRKGENKPPEEIYRELISRKEIAIILTGTRNHLKETAGYFYSL